MNKLRFWFPGRAERQRNGASAKRRGVSGGRCGAEAARRPPRYLLCPGERVVEAGHIGHDGFLVGARGVDDVCKRTTSVRARRGTRGRNPTERRLLRTRRIHLYGGKSALDTAPRRPTRRRALTLGIQHLGDVQVLLGHLEGVVEIRHRVVLERGDERVEPRGHPVGRSTDGRTNGRAPGSVRREKRHKPERGFTFLSLSYSMSSGRCLWIRALKARPSFQLRERTDSETDGQ